MKLLIIDYTMVLYVFIDMLKLLTILERFIPIYLLLLLFTSIIFNVNSIILIEKKLKNILQILEIRKICKKFAKSCI